MANELMTRKWLGDLSLEVAGNLEALFELAEENGMSITDDLQAADILSLEIDSEVTPDKATLKYYLDNDIHPATGFTAEDIAAQKGGIGYMEIGTDFKVS